MLTETCGGATAKSDQHECSVRSRPPRAHLPQHPFDPGSAVLCKAKASPEEVGDYSVDHVPMWFRGALSVKDSDSEPGDAPDAPREERRDPRGDGAGACRQLLSEQFQMFRAFMEEAVCAQLALVQDRVKHIEELLQQQPRQPVYQVQQQSSRATIGGIPLSHDLATFESVITQMQTYQEERMRTLHEEHVDHFKKEAVRVLQRQREEILEQQMHVQERSPRPRRPRGVSTVSDAQSLCSLGSEAPLRPETPFRGQRTSRHRHPLVGDWHDPTGTFFRGEAIHITSSGWRPGEARPDDTAVYTRTVVSETEWQLHQTFPEGEMLHFDAAVGKEDTLKVSSGDQEWVLRRLRSTQFRSLLNTRTKFSAEIQEDWMVDAYTRNSTDMRRRLPSFFERQVQNCLPKMSTLGMLRGGAASRFHWVTKSKTYEIVRVLFIVLDTIFLIWNVEQAAFVAGSQAFDSRNGIRDDMIQIVLADLFCLWFVADLLLRATLEGRSFLNRKPVWVFFDVFFVVAYVMEVFAHHIYLHQRSYSDVRTLITQLSMFRVLRLLHLGNMSQVIRHHTAFRELRLMLYAVQGMLKSLLWSSVMVFFILLIFGVIFTEGSISYCVAHQALADDYTALLRGNFGTLSGSMLTLFQAMSNGADWGGVYDSLGPLSWQYRWVFIFFITFTFLALMNVVTAVFVESTMQRSLMDRESVVVDEMAARREFINSIAELFHELDVSGSGSISFEDMKEQFRQPAVGLYFASLGVDANQVGRLFELLDRDNSGTIDMEEFMTGCQHLRGEAKSLDMAIIRSDLQILLQGMTDLADQLDGCMLVINRGLKDRGKREKL